MGIVRKTKSVKSVLEAFSNSNKALSVVELVKRFQDEMNKTTVYRILERLEEEGTLHSFTGKDGLKWFAQYGDQKSHDSKENHVHFQCSACGKSECLHLDIAIPDTPKHKIESTNFLLIGQCENCLV